MASSGSRKPNFDPARVFEANELSDGTLRYLALCGALLGYRLPGLIALNEPEASLHPELLEPLARLILQRPNAPRCGSSPIPSVWRMPLPPSAA